MELSTGLSVSQHSGKSRKILRADYRRCASPDLGQTIPSDAARRSTLFSEQALPADPGVGAGFLVGVFHIGGFASAHEAVSCAVVGCGVVGFAGRLHLSDGIWDGRGDACIVPGIEAMDRRFDARHRVFLGGRAVENKSGRQIAAIGCEPERLAAAPTESNNVELAIRGRKFEGIVPSAIQIPVYLVRLQIPP